MPAGLQKRGDAFVVSVGNIAMGGTGKTPFTIFLADFFSSRGNKTAILSLGYKGGLGYGTQVISDGKTVFYTPPAAADEPFMMASSLLDEGVIVITGKNRTKSYDLALSRYNPSVFILDDGFQHRKMRRDVDIVLMDYNNPLSTGFIFPFGYLRQMPHALKNADILVFTRATGTIIPKKAAKYCTGKPVFFCDHVYSGIYHNGMRAINYLAGKRMFLFSGIAGHTQFENQVSSAGGLVVASERFADHKNYSEKEIENILSKAGKINAELIVTTQKDFVKIPESYRQFMCYPVVSIHMLTDGLTDLLLKMMDKR